MQRGNICQSRSVTNLLHIGQLLSVQLLGIFKELDVKIIHHYQCGVFRSILLDGHLSLVTLVAILGGTLGGLGHHALSLLVADIPVHVLNELLNAGLHLVGHDDKELAPEQLLGVFNVVAGEVVISHLAGQPPDHKVIGIGFPGLLGVVDDGHSGIAGVVVALPHGRLQMAEQTGRALDGMAHGGKDSAHVMVVIQRGRVEEATGYHDVGHARLHQLEILGTFDATVVAGVDIDESTQRWDLAFRQFVGESTGIAMRPGDAAGLNAVQAGAQHILEGGTASAGNLPVHGRLGGSGVR